ncbi:hypothetical protein [Brenneria uluponensis]|uniref:hypothetical protein n=1 Tax=Brenneria uluponensis TaxID=3057057 RepID=UPI0028EBFAA1|nr:hypothetical protein [Brenneria ulupoensis]
MWRKKFKDTQVPEIWIGDETLTETIRIKISSAISSVELLAAEIKAWSEQAKKAWQACFCRQKAATSARISGWRIFSGHAERVAARS